MSEGLSKLYITAITALLLTSITLIGGVAASSTFGITDGNQATETDKYPAATFIGETVKITNGSTSSDYTLWDSSKDQVLTKFNQTLGIDTNNISEGRYYVNKSGLSNGNFLRVDILSNETNVSGRIRSAKGKGELKKSETEIILRYPRNLSRIEIGSSNDQINATITSISNMSSNEKVYKLNTSKLETYWIGVNNSDHAVMYKSSDSGKPRINDFRNKFRLRNGSNVTGRIVYQDGTPAKNVKVRIRGTLGIFGKILRLPYIYKPPVKTDFTGPNGFFNITGLQTVSLGFSSRQGYRVDIVNSSHARTNVTLLEDDFKLGIQSSSNYTGEYEVSDNVGGINATLTAPDSDKLRYGIIVGKRSSGKGYMKPVDPSQKKFYFGNIPNGTYSAVMFRIDTRGSGSFDSEVRPNITVQKGKNTTFNFKFEPKVIYTGYIKNKTGQPIQNVRVTSENSTNYETYTDKTNNQGKYTLRLTNKTGYTLTAYPPSQSIYTLNKTEIQVNAASKKTNLTLSEGVVLNGSLTDSNGNNVDGYVTVSNNSKNIYKSDSAENGNYRIEGLRRGIKYEVDVDTFEGGDKHKTVSMKSLSKNFKKKDFTVKIEKSNLAGYVKDGSGGYETTVKLLEDGKVLKTQNTSSKGKYNFTGIQNGEFVELKVETKSKYQSESRHAYITGNEMINITLNSPASLTGTIEDAGGTKLSDVSVYARNYSQNSYGWTETNSNGFYNLTEIKRVPHKVTYYKDGYPVKTKEVSISSYQKTKNVTFSEGKNVTGYIYRSNQRSHLNGSISIYNSSAESYGYDRIENGRFSIQGLKDQPHRVWISINGRSYNPKETQIGKPSSLSSKYKNFSINTNKGKELKVTVINNTGRVENARVVVNSRENKTNSKGIARFPSQPIGEVKIRANKDGYRGVIRTVNVSAPTSKSFGGSTKNVNISLERVNEKKLKVNVTKGSRSGQPVEDATVMFVSNQTGVSKSGSAITGSNGKAKIEHLSTGSFSVSLGLSEDNIQTTSTEINPGETQFLNIPINGKNYFLGYKVEPQ